jgi:hypothetical protein
MKAPDIARISRYQNSNQQPSIQKGASLTLASPLYQEHDNFVGSSKQLELQ